MCLNPGIRLAPWGSALEQRVISVIYKMGVKKDTSNYRPISVLNLHYKINNQLLSQEELFYIHFL